MFPVTLPTRVGIKDLYHPEMFCIGDNALQGPDEVVMYWICGIIPQTVALENNIPFMSTHLRRYMFVTDKPTEH